MFYTNIQTFLFLGNGFVVVTEGKLGCVRFSSWCNVVFGNALVLVSEGDLVSSRIPLIVNKTSRTCALPATTLHREGNHKHKCIDNNYIESWRKPSMC